MSVRKNDEAEKLWEKIRQLERMPCKTEEDFKAKAREMKALQAAYAKLTGLSCDPQNLLENEAKGDMLLFNKMFGRGPEHLTRDDLNQ